VSSVCTLRVVSLSCRFLNAADPGSDDVMVDRMLNSPLLDNNEKAIVGRIWELKDEIRVRTVVVITNC